MASYKVKICLKKKNQHNNSVTFVTKVGTIIKLLSIILSWVNQLAVFIVGTEIPKNDEKVFELNYLSLE